MALAQQGVASQVQLWPQGELPTALKDWDDRPVARITLQPGGQLRPAVCAGAIAPHAQDRFRHRPPRGAELLARLLASAPASGQTALRVGGYVAADQLPALRALCWESAQVELLTPRTMMESIHLTRVGPSEILQHREQHLDQLALCARRGRALGMFDRTSPRPKAAPPTKARWGVLRTTAVRPWGLCGSPGPIRAATRSRPGGRPCACNCRPLRWAAEHAHP